MNKVVRSPIQRQHPAQAAVETQISPFEGDYKLNAHFTRDSESMRLFGRSNKIVVGFICTLSDESGNCLAQGRGLSLIGYQGEKYIQKAILYARNASLIDASMRASKLTTIFESDEEIAGGSLNSNYQTPSESKPSDKQVNYLKSLMEDLSSDEQSELMTKLPQMNRYDVSQLINSLKTT